MSTIIWRCVGKAAVFAASVFVLPALAGAQQLIPESLAFELVGFGLGGLFMFLRHSPSPKDSHNG